MYEIREEKISGEEDETEPSKFVNRIDPDTCTVREGFGALEMHFIIKTLDLWRAASGAI